MEERIRLAVEGALAELGTAGVFLPFVVEWPADLAHGDFATNAALVAAGTLGKSPRAIADELVPLMRDALGADASKVEAAGPGFVNITLSPAAVVRVIAEAAEKGEEWGRGTAHLSERVSIEYSCPNPFKEMHIGHLMSTVIGESVARLVEASGATVLRDSYGGDVGPHVAKALWALRKKGVTEPTSAEEIGAAYAHGSRAYEESPETKAEIDTLNRDLYDGSDHELMELWRKGKELSLEEFRDLYRILDTHFDYYFFESETAASGTDIVRRHIGDVFTESQGAVIYEGEKKGLHTLVFITSQGTPTYEAKEIGLAFMKEERCPSDMVLILTAAEQVGHFAVVHAALEDIAPALAQKTTHVPHGFLRLTSGKMSSREGNVVTARSLIQDVVGKALERNEDPLIAEQVGLAAIKYSILRQSAGSDIMFDLDKSLSLEGDSGPYLQYATVRAQKILTYESSAENGSEEPDAPYAIERLIIRFPEVVARAERERAPHHVAQYLTQLAAAWNSFYASEQVLGSPEEAYKQRMVHAFANTMKNGLRLLGIATPERM